jgi:LmbE family N-acetylglucosaminyl deacetylase
MYFIMSGHPDWFIDISLVWPTKLEAIRQHRSQGPHTHENDREMERITRENGVRAGVERAEAFRVLRPS